tara:strand:+ start:20819 stop:21325 length:507 start_codon:yes stop_codon:yes gene_type:complete
MSTHDEDVEIVEEAEAESTFKTADIKKVKEELKACKSEKQEYLDGWQRAKADFINTKKRLEDEGEKKFEYGMIASVEKLLPALDSMDIALSQSEDEGLSLVQKQILDGLELEVLDPAGEMFDPNLHEPMGTVESEEKEDTIVNVLQKGYKFKETIIRPAKVQVATNNK